MSSARGRETRGQGQDRAPPGGFPGPRRPAAPGEGLGRRSGRPGLPALGRRAAREAEGRREDGRPEPKGGCGARRGQGGGTRAARRPPGAQTPLPRPRPPPRAEPRPGVRPAGCGEPGAAAAEAAILSAANAGVALPLGPDGCAAPQAPGGVGWAPGGAARRETSAALRLLVLAATLLVLRPLLRGACWFWSPSARPRLSPWAAQRGGLDGRVRRASGSAESRWAGERAVGRATWAAGPEPVRISPDAPRAAARDHRTPPAGHLPPRPRRPQRPRRRAHLGALRAHRLAPLLFGWGEGTTLDLSAAR